MNDNRQTSIVLLVLGGIAVIWISLLVAPYIDGGLIEIVNNLPKQIETPFQIEFCKDSLRSILIFLLIYLLGLGMYFSTRRNYRRGKEYGSAEWGNAKKINKKYMQFPKNQNKVLTQNLNVLVVGGSGAGKTRFYGKPNVMQCNSSYVILDPKRRNFKGYRILTRKRRI